MKTKADKTTPIYSVPALEKGLDMLELLAYEPRGLSLSELAIASSRKVSEIFRTVDCLKRRGFIRVDERTDRIILSMRMFELAHRFPPTERLIAAALPEMEALAREVGQSCHLAVHSAGNMLVIAQVDSPLQMGFAVHVGARIGLTTSSSGRVFLAYQSDAERERILTRQVNPEPVSNEKALGTSIQRIQRNGYEAVPSDLIRGVINMSYPILDISGKAVASLTIPFLQWDSHGHAGKEATRERLGKAARVLSEAIGAFLS